MEYPIRHRNHVLENLSDINLRNFIPVEWVLNPFPHDYGTDYHCEVSKDGFVIGTNFTIQLKSKENEIDKNFIVITKIKRSTINRWLKRLEPTMLIVFVNSENELYWLWFEENTVDLSKKNKEFQIKVPRLNKLSEINWNNINEKLEAIFSRKYMLYELPKNILDLSEKFAWNSFFNKDYEKALVGLKEIIKSKNDPLIWNAISVCHYEMFHLDDALIANSKALDILKDEYYLLENKAAIITELGIKTKDIDKLKIAIKLYENLIKLNSNSSNLHFNYSNALYAIDSKNEAKENILKSLKLNPNKADAWKNLGSIYHDNKNFIEELDCFETALRIDPNLPEANFNKGLTLFKEFGQAKEGLELMLKSIENSNQFDFTFPDAYFWIAEAYLSLGKIKEATFFNSRCLQLKPEKEYVLQQQKRIYRPNLADLSS